MEIPNQATGRIPTVHQVPDSRALVPYKTSSLIGYTPYAKGCHRLKCSTNRINREDRVEGCLFSKASFLYYLLAWFLTKTDPLVKIIQLFVFSYANEARS